MSTIEQVGQVGQVAGGTKLGGVELSGLTKRYGDATAVDDLTLDVQPGEFLSLLGPSGCGKTTTLRMIGGFEFPDAGTVRISGASVENLPPHKRPVNTVFQAYALFPHMTVADNVSYGLRLKGVSRADMKTRVADALAMVQMSSFASRKPAQLSGGQQQRVALARALVNRPSVLLLDEPMSALDRKLRVEMQVELKLLQSELGITFIFVTHDQEEALSMSDRVAVMRGGRIDQIGTSSEVYDNPETSFVAGFIGQQNFFDGTLSTFDATGVTIDAPGVRLYSTRPITGGSASAGATMQVAVRPEAITVAAEGADAASGAAVGPGQVDSGQVNSAHGILRGVSEIAHTLQLVVSTPNDGRIIARIPRGAASATELGSAVVCTWPADQVHVFPLQP